MNVDDALRRFAGKQASIDEVMRALVSHDAWFAPMIWASDVFATNVFEQACLWGSESAAPPRTLWLFTDAEAGLRAVTRGASPGPYVGPLRGSTLFEHLPNDVDTLEVNPGSPREAVWWMGGTAIPVGRAWGKAIALERAIETGERVAVALGMFESFGVLIAPSGTMVTAVGAAGMKNPGLIFSAADCLEAGRKKLGPAAAALPAGIVPGPTLFQEPGALGVDGYILNVGGVGPTRVFNAEACAAIADLVAGEHEVRRLQAIADDLAKES